MGHKWFFFIISKYSVIDLVMKFCTHMIAKLYFNEDDECVFL